MSQYLYNFITKSETILLAYAPSGTQCIIYPTEQGNANMSVLVADGNVPIFIITSKLVLVLALETHSLVLHLMLFIRSIKAHIAVEESLFYWFDIVFFS